MLYSELLEEEDQDLFTWLMQRSVPNDPRFEPIIWQILAHNSDVN
jgi:succinate dehydrogenase flavin-adding protein (antitoxin of CptAB toxin-antitoxin module)